MHKHIDNGKIDDEALAIKEIGFFKQVGGGAIVDVTTAGIGRDVRALERISRTTGVHIVASTGLYIEDSHPEAFRAMDKNQIAQYHLREIYEGIEGTPIRAGYIGVSDDYTAREIVSLRGAGIACRESGCGMTVHMPIFRTWGERILDVLEEEGVPLERVVLSHCDPTLYDLDYHLSLLERGCRLQFDQFSLEFPCTYGPYVKRWLPRDIERIRHIKKLCDLGWEERITVSHDLCFKSLFRTYGGPGLSHIVGNLYEYFLFEGVTEAQMDKILNKNPIAILATEG